MKGQTQPEALLRLEPPRLQPLKIEKPPLGRRVGALLMSEVGTCSRGRRHPFPDDSHVTKRETESQSNIATVQVSQRVGDRTGI